MNDTMTVDAINHPIADPPPRSLSSREQRWAEFIRDLHAWELHKLYVLGELDLHDDFMAGRCSLMDVFSMVCIEGEENPYRERTP